jgi:hypothetical protein
LRRAPDRSFDVELDAGLGAQPARDAGDACGKRRSEPAFRRADEIRPGASPYQLTRRSGREIEAMAAPRGRRGSVRPGGTTDGRGGAVGRTARSAAAAGARSEGSGRVPELLRRAFGIGFSGLFTTEELLRKAFGDSVPREWAEFAAAQTDRARRDLTERLAAELRKTLDKVSPEDLARELLRGHDIEVEARIRFVARGDRRGRGVRLAAEEES